MSGQLTKVLVVEDNETLMMLARAALTGGAGFRDNQIDEAVDGKEAYVKAKNEKYDLIVMDIDMPCDGKKATVAIRKKGKNTETIIIAHTSHITKYTSEKEIQEYKDIGFTDAIPKEPMVLIETLKKYKITPKGSK